MRFLFVLLLNSFLHKLKYFTKKYIMEENLLLELI